MKLSENWLREFVSPKINTKELSDKLTLAGLEVDSILPVAGTFSKVVIGQIEDIQKHPNANKLNICKVRIGNDEILSIVCGAQNIYEGMRVPVALVGAILPGGFKIKKSKLRGELSCGMMCSESELGMTEESNGLMDLPSTAPIGECIRQYLSLEDNIIELDLTPNRSDCLSVYGVAREVSALTQTNLLPKPTISKLDLNCDSYISINIESAEACKRYASRVIRGIDIKALTPLWMKEKLRRSGIRSISLIVDITNYVMLELGQPMHAYDLSVVEGNINIRQAFENEQIDLLDGKILNLDSSDLVIADSKKVLALAGIMGGKTSGVESDTKDILLESAFFVPSMIAGKARKHGLHTDSSHRFERGVDPGSTVEALERATQLVIQLAGGDIGSISEAGISKPEEKKISLRLGKVNALLGLNFDILYIQSALERLGFVFEVKSDGILVVIPPNYRFDINIEEDLIEEIARIYGYEDITASMPISSMSESAIYDFKLNTCMAKEIMMQKGYSEVINYSFIDSKLDIIFSSNPGIELKNPISSDMAVMRTSLLPGLLSSFKSNLSRQQDRVRIFEEGVVFSQSDSERIEKNMFSGLVFGNINPLNWRDNTSSDFFSVKSDIEGLLARNLSKVKWNQLTDCPYLHPGRSAFLEIDQKKFGIIGEIHPNVMKEMNIKSSAPIVFELDCSIFDTFEHPQYEKISKYPSISRDLAFIVNKDYKSSELIDYVREEGGKLIKGIRIFDVYQGKNLDNNKKSIAINLILQDSSQTLNEEAINIVLVKIIDLLKDKAGAELRE